MRSSSTALPVLYGVERHVHVGGGPPPHIHHREEEAFYVLEGRFSFLLGEQQSVLEAGAFVYVPQGLLHTFKNIGELPGRLLVTVTPAGLEEFFFAIGTPATDRSTPRRLFKRNRGRTRSRID